MPQLLRFGPYREYIFGLMKDCRWSLFMCMFPMECHMQMQPKYG